MRSRLEIGSSPWGEDCAQVGTDGYAVRGKAECRAFVDQLKRLYLEKHGADLPTGCVLKIVSNPHDFGSYFDVQAGFDDEDQAAVEAAYWLEANTPENWDQAPVRG